MALICRTSVGRTTDAGWTTFPDPARGSQVGVCGALETALWQAGRLAQDRSSGESRRDVICHHLDANRPCWTPVQGDAPSLVCPHSSPRALPQSSDAHAMCRRESTCCTTTHSGFWRMSPGPLAIPSPCRGTWRTAWCFPARSSRGLLLV